MISLAAAANVMRSTDHSAEEATPAPWTPDLIIYHDKCADGIVAAWACWRRWGNVPEYWASNYGQQPPTDLCDRNILIVDFSFPAETLRAMVAEGAKSIVILDHHKTAQAALEPFRFRESSPGAIGAGDVSGMLRDLDELGRPPILAIFDMERSGARMAWDFAMGGEPGRLVTLAERYDLWRFLPGTQDDAEALHVEIQARAMTVDLMEVLDGELSIGGRPIERGRSILRWRDQLVAEIAERAHRRAVAGVPDVIAVECPYSLVSAVGHHLLGKHPDAPFAAMSVTGEKVVTWSLRSRDDRMDVSEVAKSMGGGGHRNAAGFRVDLVPSVDDHVEQVPFDAPFEGTAELHELISEIAADLANSQPMWTAGMLADALILRGVGRHADIAEDRDLWKQSEETCSRQYDALSVKHVAIQSALSTAGAVLRTVKATASDLYRAADGRMCSIEGDDGEKCWIIPDDTMGDVGQVLKELDERISNAGPQPGPGGNSFRKKPVVIEAVRFDGVELVDDCMTPMFNLCFATPDWLADAMGKREDEPGAAFLEGAELHIVTLEGVMRASLGDWIIKGVQGELYPCKPDIFAASYEAAA